MNVLWLRETERILITLPPSLEIVQLYNLDVEQGDEFLNNGELKLSESSAVNSQELLTESEPSNSRLELTG